MSPNRRPLLPFAIILLSLALAPAIVCAQFAPIRPMDFSTLAGMPGVGGSSEGTGTAAGLSQPFGVAADTWGNAYVADFANHLIRKVTPAGVVTNFAGTPGMPGAIDAVGGAAKFNFPGGVAVDDEGTVYVADTGNHCIRKILANGTVSTLAGTPPVAGNSDGTGPAALFRFPNALAVAPDKTVYVSDTYNHTIRQITPDGVVTTLVGLAGQPGSMDGDGDVGRLNVPCGIAVVTARPSGRLFLYVADYENHLIRVVIPEFRSLGTYAGKAGQAAVLDDYDEAARFSHPYGLAADSAGRLYVSDTDGQTLRFIALNRYVSTIGGQAGVTGVAEGTGTASLYRQPAGLALSIDGALLIADQANHRLVRGFKPPRPDEFTWMNLIGTPYVPGTADGFGPVARLKQPACLTSDGRGNVYLADYGNHAIRKITRSGGIVGVAGNPGVPGSNNGFGGVEGFRFPVGIAAEKSGILYVADSGNHTIRRITATGVVSTLAGSVGNPGSLNGQGAAAQFREPNGLALGPDGVLYVADQGNHVIRKVTPTGLVSTLAGSPGVRGYADATGAAARFDTPVAVAVDAAGNCLVCDFENRNIRRITPGGVVSTFAGGPRESIGLGALDGHGNMARFGSPQSITLDVDGTAYIGDRGLVRKMSPDGDVVTLTGFIGFSSSEDSRFLRGPGTEATFPSASGLTVDSAGVLYVSDYLTHTVSMGCRISEVVSRSAPTEAEIFFGVLPYQRFRLEDSVNLKDWAPGNIQSAPANGGLYVIIPNPPAQSYWRVRKY